MSDPENERLQHLLAQARAGEISDAEQAELMLYVADGKVGPAEPTTAIAPVESRRAIIETGGRYALPALACVAGAVALATGWGWATAMFCWAFVFVTWPSAITRGEGLFHFKFEFGNGTTQDELPEHASQELANSKGKAGASK